jgi:hypothetical protein
MKIQGLINNSGGGSPIEGAFLRRLGAFPAGPGVTGTYSAVTDRVSVVVDTAGTVP